MTNNDAQEVIIENFKPTQEFSSLTASYASTFGQQTLQMAYSLRLIEQHLHEAAHPHVQHQLIQAFLETVSTRDPLAFHFDIARHTLSTIDPSALNNDQAIDLLAREFLKACHTLLKLIKLPPCIADYIQSCETISQELTGHTSCIRIAIFPNANPTFEEQFFSDGLSLWDAAFCTLLKSFGVRGRKEAPKLAKRRKTQKDLSFWFCTPNISEKTQFYHSKAFLGIAAILWEDGVKGRIHFQEHQVAALSTNVHSHAMKMLHPSTCINQEDKTVQLIVDSEVFALVDIPIVPANLFPAVLKGLPKLNSVYGHRLFRYEVQEPFRKKNSGDADYRVIKLDGGKSELAEILGFKGKKAGTVLGEILYAQAFLEFKHKDSSGNMIQLTRYISPTTKREEGLLITVGTMLLPYRIFEEGGLLIPLLKEPPLIGPNQYQAALYSLQMDVMAEMSKYSIDLFTQGAIHISPDRWNALCTKNEIPQLFGQQVLSRWIQDGDDEGKFLKIVEKDHYTLGYEYRKELAFLIEQGKRRKQASIAGTISSRVKRHGTRAKK